MQALLGHYQCRIMYSNGEQEKSYQQLLKYAPESLKTTLKTLENRRKQLQEQISFVSKINSVHEPKKESLFDFFSEPRKTWKPVKSKETIKVQSVLQKELNKTQQNILQLKCQY